MSKGNTYKCELKFENNVVTITENNKVCTYKFESKSELYDNISIELSNRAMQEIINNKDFKSANRIDDVLAKIRKYCTSNKRCLTVRY